jgi:predicted Zn-dependent peptidase
MKKISVKKLKNGLKIVAVPLPESPTVTVMVMVEAGTRYETAKTNGLSHFLEHMCFKGTETRKARDISYELEAMGAVTNAFTSYDYTGYYAKGKSDLFPRLLDVVSDVYLNSTFPEQEIEKERGVICGEIDMIEDMPQRNAWYLFTKALYGDQPSGYAILGPKENIMKFKKKDFTAYRDAHYCAQKTTIVVAGAVDPAKVHTLVSKAFATIKQGKSISKKKVAPKTGGKLLVKKRKTDQSHLVLGMRGLPVGHPDEMAMDLMTGILGEGMSSRLFFKLREEMGAGYYVYASHSSVDDAGEFEIATGTQPKRVPEVMDAIFGEIERMRTELVSADELAKAKEYAIGRLYMGLESSDDFARFVAFQEMFGKKTKLPAQIEKEARAVTSDDVLRVAKKYLKRDRFHGAIVGPHDQKDSDMAGLMKLLSA